MKLFKLIKSVDYVTYPTYREVAEINKKLGDSLDNFRDMLISAIIGIALDTMFISTWLLKFLKCRFPKDTLLGSFARAEGAGTLLALLIVAAVYLLIKLARYICYLKTTNKDTDEKRAALVHGLYNIIIPQLVETKSIWEQFDADPSVPARKRFLLLVQAEHEICDLFSALSGMQLIVKDKEGKITEDSADLLSRIGKHTYASVLDEMLDTAYEIYSQLNTWPDSDPKEELDNLAAVLRGSSLFPTGVDTAEFKRLDEKYGQIKRSLA